MAKKKQEQQEQSPVSYTHLDVYKRQEIAHLLVLSVFESFENNLKIHTIAYFRLINRYFGIHF